MCIVEWRSGNINNEIGLLCNEFVHRTSGIDRIVIAYIPKVFANGEGDFFSFEIYGVKFTIGFKITVFIKDVVSGQQRFVHHACNFSFVKQYGRIKQVFTFYSRIHRWRAYNDSNIVRERSKFIHRLVTTSNKIWKL